MTRKPQRSHGRHHLRSIIGSSSSLVGTPSRPGEKPVPGAPSARTRHPHPLAFDAPIQLAASAVLAEESLKVPDQPVLTLPARAEGHAEGSAGTASLEREAKRLAGAISRLLDQIEPGQSVGTRLKARQEELDVVRAKLDTPPDIDREAIAALVAPLGPLVGLGEGDPVVIRQVLRKIGVERITVWPEGDGWRFEVRPTSEPPCRDGYLPLPPIPPGHPPRPR